jgi:hypothetical protein
VAVWVVTPALPIPHSYAATHPRCPGGVLLIWLTQYELVFADPLDGKWRRKPPPGWRPLPFTPYGSAELGEGRCEDVAPASVGGEPNRDSLRDDVGGIRQRNSRTPVRSIGVSQFVVRLFRGDLEMRGRNWAP